MVEAPLAIDHVICLELGGADDDDNLQALCQPHHLEKTARDMKLIAKMRRLLARQDGTRRPRKAISSRGFPKGQKRAWPTQRFP